MSAPIPERHRVVFYLGHLEAFDWNQICRWTLGQSSFHDTFDSLFEAGIDPEGRLATGRRALGLAVTRRNPALQRQSERVG